MIHFALAAIVALPGLWPRVDADGFPLPPGAVARIGSTRFLHNDNVWCSQYSPDGRWLATVTSEEFVHVWDSATGRELMRLERAWPLRVGTDGVLTVATRALDQEEDAWVYRLQRFDVSSRKLLSSVRLSDHTPLALSPDGRRAGFATEGRIGVIDTTTGKDIWSQETLHRDWPRYSFTPGGKYIAFAKDYSINLFEADTGKSAGSFEMGKGWINFFAFSTDGKLLVASDSEHIVVWGLAQRNQVFSMKAKADSMVECAFVPGSHRLVIAEGDEVGVWDLPSQKRILSFRARGRVPTVSPDGKTVVLIYGCGLQLYDLATGKLLHHSSVPFPKLFQIPFGPDGKLRTSTWVSSRPDSDPDALDTEIRTDWDPATGRTTTFSRTPRHVVFDWTADESRYITKSGSTANLYDARTGQAVRGFAVDDHLNWAQIDPAGERVFGFRDQELVVWSTDGLRRASIPEKPEHLQWQNIKVLPDGRLVATVLWGSTKSHSWTGYRPRNPDWTDITLWNSDTGRVEAIIRVSGMWGTATFSTDRSRLVLEPGRATGKLAALVGDANYLRPAVFDATTGRQMYSLPVPLTRSELACEFSPDSRILAAGHDDGNVRLIDVESGRVQKVFNQGDMVDRLSFSTDGRWLGASGGQYGTVLVWDVQEKLGRASTVPLRKP